MGLADFGLQDEIEGLDGMEVEAGEIVVTLGEQPLGIVMCLTAIEAGEGGNVELELDVLLLQADVVAMVHITISLGMGKHDVIATTLDEVDKLPEIDGLTEIACLNQQMVAIVGDGQEIATLQATLKQTVEHVLGALAQLDVARVFGHEFVKSLTQVGWTVGEIFHHMRGKPYTAHSQFLITPQYMKGIVEVLYSVVNTGQQMTVPVGVATEQAGFLYCCLEKHHSE